MSDVPLFPAPAGKKPEKQRRYLPDLHRSLPKAEEAEKGVLSSIYCAPAILISAADIVPTSAFYVPAHQIILGAMLELHEDSKPLDFAILVQLLKDKGELEKVGGAAKVSEILTFMPTAANADYYIDIVREKAWLRELIRFCTEFAGRGYEEHGDIGIFADEFQKKALKLTQRTHRIERESLGETISRRWEEIREGKQEVITGVSTGFPNLDRHNFRLPRAETVMIAGPISSGKSSFVFNVLESVSVSREFTTAVFSKEMKRARMVDSLCEIISGVNTKAVADKRVSDNAIEEYRQAGLKVARAASRIELFGKEDCGGMLFPALMNECRQLKARVPDLRFVFVDYDELFMPKPLPRHTTKEIELTNISAWANELAGELDVTVILLSQMTGDTLRHAKGKAADCHAVATIAEDGDDRRIVTIEKNRDDGRDVKTYFKFTGANKRWCEAIAEEN